MIDKGLYKTRKDLRVGGASGREYDKSYSDRQRTDSPMPSSAVTRTRTDSGDRFAFDDPTLSEKTDFVTQKFTGPSFFNRSGYSDVDPRTGEVKRGMGSKILGGILSLVTGIPGLGFGLDYLRNKFSPRPRDMSAFNQLGLLTDRTILGPSTNPNNLDIYNEFVDEEEDSTKRFTDTGTLTDPNAQYLYDRDKIVSLMKNFIPAPNQVGGITNTKVEPPDFMFASPQFQEGLDNSMYGGDRMLFGANNPNELFYYGDVLPGGNIIQTDADGITNYDFDTPVRVGPENTGFIEVQDPPYYDEFFDIQGS